MSEVLKTNDPYVEIPNFTYNSKIIQSRVASDKEKISMDPAQG